LQSIRTRSAVPVVAPERRAPEAVPLALASAGLLGLLVVVAPLSVVGAATRGVTFAATLVAVGVCVFARLAHDGAGAPEEDGALRRAVVATAVVGVVASFGWLAIDVVDIAGRGLAGITDSTSVHIVMRNGSYASAALRSLGLAVLAYVALARWRAITAGPLVAVGALMACAWCMLTGHPATHGPTGIVHAMTFLHVAAAAVWFGGLVALGLVIRHRRGRGDLAGGAAIVHAFSRLMTWTVAGLLIGGTVMALAFLGGIDRLTSTTYGLVLLAKIGLALSILGVAGYNHRRLVPAVQAGDERGWRMLGRTVAIEQLALIGVLALTAILVNLDPHS